VMMTYVVVIAIDGRHSRSPKWELGGCGVGGHGHGAIENGSCGSAKGDGVCGEHEHGAVESSISLTRRGRVLS
jgi:hypothetical protein